MAHAPSTSAAVKRQDPVRRFENHQAAVQAMTRYEAQLQERASQRRVQGLPVTDQDQPEESFHLVPAHRSAPSLAIIGGMGALAGARAFRRACERFGDSRAVVLHQACTVPDRSTIILQEGTLDSPVCRAMAARLAGAVRVGVRLASQAGQPVHCIVACNSAHYFWRLLKEDVEADLLGVPSEVQMISLVDASVEALKVLGCKNVLVLTTEGARVGEVFAAPFRQAGIVFEEPSVPLSGLLMRSIFEGIKSVNHHRAAELGNEFFEAILRTGRAYDCILAGCTELPLTIDLLKLHGSAQVAAFLSRVNVVDPLEEALTRA